MLAQMKAEAALMCGDIICWRETHWVVAGSADDTVRVWATEAGMPLYAAYGFQMSETNCALSKLNISAVLQHTCF